MKKSLLAALVVAFSAPSVFGQIVPPIDTVFTENFDLPLGADSISANYNTDAAAGSRMWNDTNFVASTGTLSFHSQLYSNDTIIFETDAFSTVTYTNVRFSFDHIAKLRYNQKGFIQMSRDNGATWVTINSGYKGSSPQFATTGWFNELSYPTPALAPFWQGPTLSNTSAGVAPDNSWWAHEIFDLSSYLGAFDAVNNQNGFAQCKIRFMAMPKSGANPAPTSLAGWFVDNIMVEAAPCELEPPALNWNNVSVYAKPDGARYMPSQDVRVQATDNVGLLNMRIFFRRYDYSAGTWSAWTDSLMTPSSGATCLTTNTYEYTFGAIGLYDTINWYVRVSDCACPNVVQSPDFGSTPAYYSFWRDDAPPPICGNTTSNSFPTVVSQFPYMQNFQNAAFWVAGTGTGATGTTHRGDFPISNPPTGINWDVTPTDIQPGYGWSIRKGATATNFTGPNADATLGNSQGVYLYTEADQGSSTSTTSLRTSCFDLTGLNCAMLRFKYHMYGAQINRLRIDVDTGFNTSAWVTGVDEIIGQQQTTSAAPWAEYSVSLNDFVGDIVRIRIVGLRGNGAAGDIAIDDIEVFEPTPVDIALRDVYNPENGYCSYSNNELVDLWLQSEGCVALDTVAVTWKREYTDLAGTITTTTHTELITYKTLQSGDSASYSFVQGPDMSGYGTYRIWVYADMPNDTLNDNDTIGPIGVVHEEPYATMPFIADFDGAGNSPGNNTAVNPGTHAYTDWTMLPASNSGQYAFMVGTGFTPTVATGPLTAYGGTGNYLVTEGDYGTPPTSATFISPCIDLGTMTNPVLQYRVHMYGADAGAVVVQWKQAGDNQWSNPSTPLTTKLTDEKSPWAYREVDLSSQAGQIIKLRFVAQKTGSGIAADIALDEIAILDKAANDVGIQEIINPAASVNLIGAPATQQAQFSVRNYGSSNISNIPITYVVTPTCGTNAGVSQTYTFTYNGTINAGEAVTVTDPTVAPWPIGSFEVTAYTGLSGDSYSFNDTMVVQSVGWPETPINNGFYADFENCNLGNEEGFWGGGHLQLFQLDQINALGGNNGYGSYPNKNTPGGVVENLYFPRFTDFDTIAGARLIIEHDIDLGTGDEAYIEYLAGGSWQTLGYWDPQGVVSQNWYNSGSSSTGGSWTGNLGTQVSIWPLSFYNYSNAPLILRARLVTASGNKDGWNIDAVGVEIPPQNSASPRVVETVEYIPVPDQDNHLRTVIQNTGAKVLDSCMVEFSTDGGTTWSNPEKVVFNPPLFPEKTAHYEFDQVWASPSSGAYNVCIRTSLPDSKPDNLTSDDLKCETIVIPDKIVMAVDSAYCNDFEDAAQTPWLTFNTFDKTGLNSWEFGSPNQSPIIGANSGNNAWMTKLTQDYKRRDSSALFTPVFVLDSGETYTIEFMHFFSTERYHDGGTVDITFDGGVTWHTVGSNLFGAQWFNTNYVTSIDLYKPGWTGESGGWIPASLNVQVDTARNAIFRFRFASDETIEGTGWAVDDFCFFTSNAIDRIYVVGQEELEEYVGVGRLFPNPTNGATRIPVSFQESADIVITVRNAMGQLIMQRTEHGNEGIQVFEIETAGWAAGMYLVETTTPQGTHTQRLIVE